MSSSDDQKKSSPNQNLLPPCSVASYKHDCRSASWNCEAKRIHEPVNFESANTIFSTHSDSRIAQTSHRNALYPAANRRSAGDNATRIWVGSSVYKPGSTFSCVSKSRWWLREKFFHKPLLPCTRPVARLVPCEPYGAGSRRKRKCTKFSGSVPFAVLYDQYYTRDDVARALYAEFVKRYNPDLFQMVEPSAGAGAFFMQMPYGSLAVDIDPKGPGIIKANYLERRVEGGLPVATIGNPPFGAKSSMAVAFFNHAATQSAVIAFVLPRTFRKRKLQNRLNRNFHLVHEQVVPPNAFLFMGKPYNVPAVFQIWERRGVERALHITKTNHPDFEFTTRDKADFAIQRVGARAGRTHHDFERSANSHYFIRVAGRSTKAIARVKRIMRMLDFAGAAGNVAGNPSLAKSEIVALYQAFITRHLHRKLR